MSKKRNVAKRFGASIAVAAITLSALSMTPFVASAADTGTDVTIGTEHATKKWFTSSADRGQTLVKFGDGAEHKFFVPSVEDRCSLRYYGVDKFKQKAEDVKIYGYRIIESNYNQYGFIGWTETKQAADLGVKLQSFDKNVNNVSQVVVKDNFPYLDKDGKPTTDIAKRVSDNPTYNKSRIITSDNITTLAREIQTDPAVGEKFAAAGQRVELVWSEENQCYMTKDAKPGSYVVLVEKEDRGIIYNPVIISNDYADANVCVSLANYVPTTQGDAEKANHDSAMWNAHAFPYEAGVDWSANGGNGAFVGYGTVHPKDVQNLTTNGNRDLSPQEQSNYLKSHTAVVYERDTQFNGNVFTLDHDHVPEKADPVSAHDGEPASGATAGDPAGGKNDGGGKYAGVALGKEFDIETMALQGRAYAKKSTIQLEKNIVNASVPKSYANAVAQAPQGYSKYEDVSEGDEITYDVFTSIPFYANNYFKDEDKFLFSVTDTQHEGLAPVKAENIHVWASNQNNKTDAQAIANDLVKTPELSKENYVVTINKDNSFTVSFTKDFCLSNKGNGAKVVIRYNTTVTNQAKLGLNGNPNEVFLEYTTIPTSGNTTSRGYKFDFAVTYTFSPTAFKLAEDGTVSAAADADGIVTDETQKDLSSEQMTTRPLEGARFMLQRVGSNYSADGLKAGQRDIAPLKDADGKLISNVDITKIKNKTEIAPIENVGPGKTKTLYYNGYQTWFLTADADGMIKFDSTRDGIDEGIYTLQEIESPKDYAINEKIYVINVNPKFDENVQRFIGADIRVSGTNTDADGKIKTYDVKGSTFVDGTNYDYDAYGKLIKEYTYTEWLSEQQDKYSGKIAELANASTDKHNTTIKWDETDTNATKKKISADMIGIINTKLTRLPSTGGAGTLLYTLGGFTLMGAAVLVVGKKKKEDADNQN